MVGARATSNPSRALEGATAVPARFERPESRDDSLSILFQLNLCWDQLSSLIGESKSTGIGHFGASFSSFAAEGALRGIQVVPIEDLNFLNVDLDRYRQNVSRSLDRLATYFRGLDPWPVGFEPPDSIHANDWDMRRDAAIGEAFARLVIAPNMTQIPLPDRCFSATVVCHVTPQHSFSYSYFIEHELPEILRMTDRRAVIYPLAMFETRIKEQVGKGGWDYQVKPELSKLADGRQVKVCQLTNPIFANPSLYADVLRIARSRGFDVTLENQKQTVLNVPPSEDLRNVAALAVFQRMP